MIPMATPKKAVLMCGGLGTRLRPWSYVIPKPMFPIGEKPILELLLERLREHGVAEVYLSLGYKAELIEMTFKDGTQLGLSLHYVREESPLGTAGALSLLRDHLNEPFLMMNGDLVTRLDFGAMAALHAQTQATITVGTKRYEVNIPYGVVDDDGGIVTALREKPTHSVQINAGIYLIDPAALDVLPTEGRYDATSLITDNLARGRRVSSYDIREYWVDIGRVEDYERAQRDFQQWMDENAGSATEDRSAGV